DVYFYEVARRLGVDKIAAMANRFGLGAISGIGLPNEKPGLIPTEAWKKATRNQRWSPGDTLNVGIGQGDVLATPIQLATLAARIANGGVAVKPRLVRPAMQPAMAGTEAPPAEIFESLNIPLAHLDVLRQGMFDVVNGPPGTTTAMAARLRFDDPEKKSWTM